MARKIRVGILFGGRSAEHEVSLQSAKNIIDAIDSKKYEVVLIGIDKKGRWHLSEGSRLLLPAVESGLPELPDKGENLALVPGKQEDQLVAFSGQQKLGRLDVIFPVLHGPFGEDGTVQGLLELAGVPYIGAGVAASALAMDKDLFKKVLRDSGIPVARHHAIRLGDPPANPFGYPVFVKPARLGSSVGISKVHDESELEPAVALARRHDEKVLVEEFVPGIEVEVGVLGNLPTPQASLPGQVVSHFADWYDWSSKYDEGGSDLLIPAPTLSDEQNARAQKLAVSAFVATECEGMARADFFVDQREESGQQQTY